MRKGGRKGRIDKVDQKELLVTTELLQQKEEEWKKITAQAEQIFCETTDSVKGLRQVFCGRSVLALETDFLAQKEKGKNDFERLMRHLEKLEVIAFVYDKVERENHGFINRN